MKTKPAWIPTFAALVLITLFPACPLGNAKEYTIEQFYKNKRITGGAFSPDETKLLISSNESGIFNLFEISIEDGTARQLTRSTTESYFAIDYVPATGEILFTADQGGNENNHIYLLKSDGNTVDLTPGENKKTFFAGWSEDKSSFYYGSNKRDPKFFDIYRMNVDDWTSSLLYENEKGLSFSGIARDGKKLAFSEPITTSENRLYVVDVDSNDLQEVSDPDHPASYQASGFNNKGTSLHYTTNANLEFGYLAKYDIETGKREIVYQTDWDVMYSYTSKNEKYRVIAINEDAQNSLVLIDNETGKTIDFPTVPDGDILGVSISDSETKMRLTIGTSRSPNNLYAYDFDSRKLTKLTSSLNPEIDPADLVKAEIVRYPSFDELEIPAVFYKPQQASESNPVAALVLVHGGPGGQSRVGFSELIQFLVNHGYAILAVNNRGSSGYGKTFHKLDDRNHGDKDLLDCIHGKYYLQSLPYIDSEKIGIMGGSYGGFMTMAAMTFHPDEFQVGVNIFGVTNWLRTLKSIPPHWESFKEALYAEMGDPAEDEERLRAISPLFHADAIKNPVMVLQGANDIRVLQVESDEIVQAIKTNNVPVEYVVFPDEGHGFRKNENQIKGYGQVLEFLDQYLKAN